MLKGQRAHAHVDKMVFVFSWANQYSTISRSMNPADLPSRELQKSDATLSLLARLFIQYLFGPHTVDLFSLDSNAMCDDSGEMLKHFTPFPSPNLNVYMFFPVLHCSR